MAMFNRLSSTAGEFTGVTARPVSDMRGEVMIRELGTAPTGTGAIGITGTAIGRDIHTGRIERAFTMIRSGTWILGMTIRRLSLRRP
jgi:hypothetical protein